MGRHVTERHRLFLAVSRSNEGSLLPIETTKMHYLFLFHRFTP